MRGGSLVRPLLGFGIFVVISLLATMSIWSTLAKPVNGRTISMRAYFVDATGLRAGDDVRIAGVRVGRVSQLKVDNGLALVEFDLSSEQAVYPETTASVRYQDLTGRRYLGLSLPGASHAVATGKKTLSQNTIGVERTIPSFDVTSLLNGFAPLFGELDPAAVNTLSANIVDALQGNDVSISTLLAQTTALARTVADDDAVIGSIVTNLNAVVATVDRQLTNTDRLVDEMPRFLDAVNRHRGEIGTSVRSVSKMAGDLSATLAQLRSDVTGSAQNTVAITSFLNRDGAKLSLAIPGIGRMANIWSKSTGNGSYWNIYSCNLDISLYGVLFPPNVISSIGGSQHSETCRR
ncbi:MCE family protein [Gordonia sp. CPCC 205333]|uniref:MCE family protein n=1 Tax=Gordonia sp. CPCC 205333 TaxID=3140790 RepID=UPI003AF3F84F